MTRDRQVPQHDVFEFRLRRSRFCVVIPVINENGRIHSQLSQMKALDLGVDTIIADGGSTDGSTDHAVLIELGVRTLLVKKDTGRLGAQQRMGFAYALDQGYEGVVTLDGNNKDGPEAIPRFITALDAGVDFVQGSRFMEGGVEENTPWIRRVAVRFFHAPIISWLARFPYTDTTNAFRAYSARYLLNPEVQPFRDVFDGYQLLAYLSVKAPTLGLRTCEIPVRRSYPARAKTPTKISPIRGNLELLRVLLDLMLGRFDPSPDGHE